MTAVSVNVHVSPGALREVRTFDATGGGAAFVSLRLGGHYGEVTLMIRNEQALDELAAMVAEARAGLAAAVNRAKQPELPDLVAS